MSNIVLWGYSPESDASNASSSLSTQTQAHVKAFLIRVAKTFFVPRLEPQQSLNWEFSNLPTKLLWLFVINRWDSLLIQGDLN